MKNRTIIGIQYLRGYAAILVVITHFFNSGGYIADKLHLKLLGEFGVDIFFIISGFIMAYTLKDYDKSSNVKVAKDFIKKRIFRIYPIYFIILAPMMAIYMIKVFIGKTDLSISSLFGSFFLVPDITGNERYRMINPPTWTLVYEMFFYITLTLFISITKNKKRCVFIYSIAMLSCISIVSALGLQGEKNGWVNFSYMLGDTLLIDFIFGFILFYIKDVIKLDSIKPIVSFTLCLIITIFALYLSSNGIPRIVCYGVNAFLIVSIFTFSKKMSDSYYRIPLILGTASYSIYLSHPLLFPIHTVLKEKFKSSININLIDLSFSIIAIIIGVIIYYKIEQRLANKLKAKNTIVSTL